MKQSVLIHLRRLAAAFLLTLVAGLSSQLPGQELQTALERREDLIVVTWTQVPGHIYRLQHRARLDDSPWTTTAMSAANRARLPLRGTSGFYRVIAEPPPLDPTDYNADRILMADRFQAVAPQYWAQYGIPPLARMASMRHSLGQDPMRAFDSLRAAFDQLAFLEVLEAGPLPPEFRNRVLARAAGGGRDFWQPLVMVWRDYVGEYDAIRAKFGPSHPRLGQITQILAASLPASLNLERLTRILAPNMDKMVHPALLPPSIRLEDHHGMDGFCDVLLDSAPPAAKPGDTDTTVRVAWTNITSSAVWDTTYNPACAGVAVGACAAKLGLLKGDTDCKEWNELGKALGSEPGAPGATADGIAAWFAAQGMSCTKAWTGFSESAAQEAKAALDRGCDVNIRYISADGTQAHREMVTGITVDPADPNKCEVQTVSWGQSASVTYEEGAIGSGGFSGKSDGERYRAAGQAKSWLEQGGTAELLYYCKK